MGVGADSDDSPYVVARPAPVSSEYMSAVSGPAARLDLDRVENAGPDSGLFTGEFAVVLVVNLRGGEPAMDVLLSAHADYQRSRCLTVTVLSYAGRVCALFFRGSSKAITAHLSFSTRIVLMSVIFGELT